MEVIFIIILFVTFVFSNSYNKYKKAAVKKCKLMKLSLFMRYVQKIKIYNHNFRLMIEELLMNIKIQLDYQYLK